jgi:hypothetical protein
MVVYRRNAMLRGGRVAYSGLVQSIMNAGITKLAISRIAPFFIVKNVPTAL